MVRQTTTGSRMHGRRDYSPIGSQGAEAQGACMGDTWGQTSPSNPNDPLPPALTSLICQHLGTKYSVDGPVVDISKSNHNVDFRKYTHTKKNQNVHYLLPTRFVEINNNSNSKTFESCSIGFVAQNNYAFPKT